MAEFVDPARAITKIKFSVYAQYKMPSIGFFDGDDELVACYDPEGYGFEVNT